MQDTPPMKKPPISKTLCVIPWIHLNIVPNGKVLHCCMTSDTKDFIGDLSTESIEEIWNSEKLRTIRTEMLQGAKPKVCSKCYEKEDSAGTSQRLTYSRSFLRKLFEIPRITNPSGHVEKIDLKYWDFRFSNLCNLRCRTCGPDYSSAWVPDAKKLGWLAETDAQKILHIDSVGEIRNVDFIRQYLPQAERIYFAGGEPLLMDEHWQILDLLDSQQRYDVSIVYNTNFSTLSYKGKNAVEYWLKWGRNILVCPSIDEIDERAELLRSGTVWKTVETNLITVSNLGVRLNPNITVSIFNVARLPDIIDRLIELGVIKKEKENFHNFSLNLVEGPAYYNVSVLPVPTRRRIIQRLNDYLDKFKDKRQADISRHFLQLFDHLKIDQVQDQTDVTKKTAQRLVLKSITQRIDSLRNEKTSEIMPELKEILE
jgi:radical SAM protein with 4Fe4S-binding SPASM domain